MLKYIFSLMFIVFLFGCSSISTYKFSYELNPNGANISCANSQDIIDGNSEELNYVETQNFPPTTIKSEELFAAIQANKGKVPIFVLNNMNICHARWYSGVISYKINLKKYETLKESFKILSYKMDDEKIEKAVSNLNNSLSFKELDYMKYYVEFPLPMERYDDNRNFKINFMYPKRAYKKGSYQKDLDYEMKLKGQAKEAKKK